MAGERGTRTAPIDLDALTLGAIRDGGLAGRPITVLGLARSGAALARFFADAGARVTIYDGRPAPELATAIDSLGGRDVRLALGPDVDPAASWADAALVASSPSINPDFPTTEPRLREALRALRDRRLAGDLGVPVLVWEVDLFLRLCPAPTVGITGTKGKTTTASLTHALLATDAAHPAILGGNIGLPLVERLPELTERHRVVVELSELQLPTLSHGTTVAAYTNVTSDHIDRHGSLAAYRAVKRRLGELVDPGGAVVLNLDDPVVATYADVSAARTIRYRRGEPPVGGVGVTDGWIVVDGIAPIPAAAVDGKPADVTCGPVVPVAELGVPGEHNVSNALAAVAVASVFGIPPDDMRRAARTFHGVEHRLEHVATIDGVRFVNDSQGTQPDAVIAALRAFEPPVVLIAGGRDKGIDLRALPPVVAERAAAAVLIGESGAALEGLFRAAGLATTTRESTLEQAVATADRLARDARERHGAAVATVLLSPAAASFDMFPDYEARGRAFKAAVRALGLRR